MITTTYTVLVAFMDVKGARHVVGETIVDGSIIPPALISRGYVQVNTIADPDAITDARIDAIETAAAVNAAADALVDERLTTIEADTADIDERLTTVEAIVSTIGA